MLDRRRRAGVRRHEADAYAGGALATIARPPTS